MNALDLCDKFCPDKLKHLSWGGRIGTGNDGEVCLTNKPNIVIKFSVLFERENNDVTDHYLKITCPALSYLKDHLIDCFARIYTHEYLGTFFQDSQKIVLHFYTMEKLEEISDDEAMVFHTTVSHEDNNKKKDYSISEVQTILRDMGRSLDFDETRIIAFHKALKKAPINHSDIHPRNIMKDKKGNFRLIDFDSCQLKLPCNP